MRIQSKEHTWLNDLSNHMPVNAFCQSNASRISSSYLSLIEIQIVVYTICISAGVNKILMGVDNLTLTSFFVPSFSIRSNTSSNGILGNRRWAQCSKYRMMICRSLACNNTNQIITMSYPFNMWLYSIVNFKDHVRYQQHFCNSFMKCWYLIVTVDLSYGSWLVNKSTINRPLKIWCDY